MAIAGWGEVVSEAQSIVASGRTFRRRWSTLRRLAGKQRVTASDRSALQEALATAGLASIPPVDLVVPRSEDWIRIVSTAEAPQRLRLRFQRERHLEKVVAESLPAVDALAGVQLVDRQYRVDGNRKIDVLGRRRIPSGHWRWVVIEIERGDGHKESPSQVLDYVHRLRRTNRPDGTPMVREGDEVEVVVISQDADSGAAEVLRAAALSAGIEARWLLAEIKLTEI